MAMLNKRMVKNLFFLQVMHFFQGYPRKVINMIHAELNWLNWSKNCDPQLFGLSHGIIVTDDALGMGQNWVPQLLDG